MVLSLLLVVYRNILKHCRPTLSICQNTLVFLFLPLVVLKVLCHLIVRRVLVSASPGRVTSRSMLFQVIILFIRSRMRPRRYSTQIMRVTRKTTHLTMDFTSRKRLILALFSLLLARVLFLLLVRSRRTVFVLLRRYRWRARVTRVLASHVILVTLKRLSLFPVRILLRITLLVIITIVILVITVASMVLFRRRIAIVW